MILPYSVTITARVSGSIPIDEEHDEADSLDDLPGVQARCLGRLILRVQDQVGVYFDSHCAPLKGRNLIYRLTRRPAERVREMAR